MLRADMVSEAQELVEDPAYWTATRLTTLFNRGMRDVSNAMGVATSGYFTFLSVVGQQQYQLPYDWLQHELMTFDSNGATNTLHLKPRPHDVFGTILEPTQQGTPEVFFLWAKEDREEIWIYPTFDTAGLVVRMFYWRRPPNIVLDNDEPLIPRSWHTYLVEYAVNYALQQDQEKGWNYALFTNWWNQQKQAIQVSDTVGSASHDDIRLGMFEDQLPRRSGQHGHVNVSEVGVIW